MKRRDFFKFLGIGAATAVVAPKVLMAPTPEVYPETSGGQITFEMLHKAYVQAIQPKMAEGSYIRVHLAPTSKPARTGEFVYYKPAKEYLAYTCKKPKFDKLTGHTDLYGMAICNITPGNYAWLYLGPVIWGTKG
jgi:hypothetical protein